MKLKLILIDSYMNSCEIEIDQNQYKMLGIDIAKAKKHSKKRDLNVEITEFLKKFKRK